MLARQGSNADKNEWREKSISGRMKSKGQSPEGRGEEQPSEMPLGPMRLEPHPIVLKAVPRP